MSNAKKNCKRYRVVVIRSEFARFEVDAENEDRAHDKAAYKAGNGFITDWRDVCTETHGVEVKLVEEVAS